MTVVTSRDSTAILLLYRCLRHKEVKKDMKMIRIHNVYNSSFISFTSKNNSFTLSKIMRFIVETFDDYHILLKNFNFHHFFLKRLVSFDAARRDRRSTRHNAKSQSHSDSIERLDHVKSSQFDQHHKSHVHDDSFSEKIKTLHDTF